MTSEQLAPQQDPSQDLLAELTAVYSLQREVLFQVPPERHLISILAHSAIVGQDEVGMHAVESGELAERVSQRLVQAHHLQGKGRVRAQDLSLGSSAQRPISMHSRVLIEVKEYNMLPRTVLLKLSVVKD